MVRKIPETVNISDGLSRLGTWLRVIPETVNISENLTRLGAQIRVIPETINISDGLSRLGTWIRVIPEIINIADAKSRLGTWIRKIPETVNITDGIEHIRGRIKTVITEVVNISETVNNVLGIVRVASLETVSIQDTPDRQFSCIVTRIKFDCCAVTDSVGCNDGTWARGCEAYTTGKLDGAGCFVTGDAVELANEANFDREHNQPMSITAWVKLTSNIDTSHYIVTKSAGTSAPGITFFQNGSDRGWRFRFESECCAIQAANGTDDIVLCTWTHIAGTYSGNSNANGMKIYKDGALIATGSDVNMPATILTCNPVRIGARNGPSGATDWEGQIDDVQWYHKELTACEVRVMAEPTVRKMALTRKTPETINITESLSRLGTWIRKISETVNISEGIVKLVTGAGVIIKEILETINITDTKSRLGTWIRKIPETVNITEGISRLGAQIRVIPETVNISEGVKKLIFTAGAIVKRINETINIADAKSRLGTWIRKISETVNITDTPQRLGGLIREVNNTLNVSEAVLKLKITLKVISETINIADAKSRLGTWIRQTNESIIVQDERDIQYSCIVARYKFDGDATDSVGCNDGTWEGTEQYTTGKVGQGGCFGAAVRIRIANDPVFDFEPTSAFSITAWVKHEGAFTTNDVYVSKRQTFNNSRGWNLLRRFSTRDLVWEIDNGCGCELQVDTPNGSIDETCRWYHIAATYDGSANELGMEVYIDGKNETVNQVCFPIGGTMIVPNDVLISGIGNGGGGVEGNIDDVQIYSRALTPEEIRIMAHGTVRRLGLVRKIAETLNISESLSRLGTWIRQKLETINILETVLDILNPAGPAPVVRPEKGGAIIYWKKRKRSLDVIYDDPYSMEQDVSVTVTDSIAMVGKVFGKVVSPFKFDNIIKAKIVDSINLKNVINTYISVLHKYSLTKSNIGKSISKFKLLESIKKYSKIDLVKINKHIHKEKTSKLGESLNNEDINDIIKMLDTLDEIDEDEEK